MSNTDIPKAINPGSSTIVSPCEPCYIRPMKLGVGKLQAAFCGVLLLLPCGIIAAAPGDRGRILPPEFVRPSREKMMTDESRVIQLLTEKSRREPSKVEPLLHTKPSHTSVVVHRDAVEEIYRRSPAGGFEPFPLANKKQFRRIPANNAGGGYRVNHSKTHGRDIDN